MKKIISSRLFIVLFWAAIAVLLFLISSHSVSLSHRLTRAHQAITQLQQQLALERTQRCEQTYSWKGGRNYPFTMSSDDRLRNYRVHTPPDYTADQRYPVVVVFDGLNGSSERAEIESGFNETPTLTVYPDALIGSTGATAWQGAPYSPQGVNDVQFISDMVTQLTRTFCVDTEAVYLVGMSNGAGFAHLAACELGDTIAGVAGISGAYYQPCKRLHVPRVVYIHSADDGLVPYKGSHKRRLPPVYQHARHQGVAAQCQQLIPVRRTDIERFSWTRCQNDQQISLIVIRQQPHGWLHISDDELVPDGSLSRHTTHEIIWGFFTK